MESGLPGKVGLPVAKHVATGRGFVYDCVIIPLLPTKEKIVKEKEKKSEDCLVRHCPVKSHFLRG